MNFVERNIFTLCGLVAGLIISLIIFSTEVKINGEEISCYDRYSNLIEGQKCIVQNGFETESKAYIGKSIASFIDLTILIIFGRLVDKELLKIIN